MITTPTPPELIGAVIASLGAGTVIGWIFRSGRFTERIQQAQEDLRGSIKQVRADAKKDADGVGSMARDIRAVAQRRWLHEVADRIEELEPKDKAARLAHRVREDAWRN